MSDGLKVDVTGQDAIARAVAEQLASLPGAVQIALLVEGAAIAADAAQRCPVDTGTLKGSVYVIPAGTGVQVGFSAPYAVEVHERTDISHDDGEPKFLEKAKNAAASTLASQVAARVKIG